VEVASILPREDHSPINETERRLIAAIEQEFKKHGVNMPLYWGNRQLDPAAAGPLKQMQSEGIRRAAALYDSALDLNRLPPVS